MNVIGNTTYTETFAIVVPHDRREISVEIGTHGLIENRAAVLRAKDNMDEKKCQRPCHDADYRSGLHPSHFCSDPASAFVMHHALA